MRILKGICFGILLSHFLLFSPAFGANAAKIGMVDFQRILDTSNAGKAARAEINNRGKQLEAELKKRGAEVEERRRKLDQEALVMKREVLEEKQRELRISIDDLKDLQRKYMDEFKQFETDWVARIQKDVLEIIEETGKAEGYLLIVEKREGGVLYVPPANDMTDKIIQKYNAQFAKTSGRGGEKRR